MNNKRKIDKLIFIKTKNLCIKEYYLKGEKTTYKVGAKLCKLPIKGRASRIYRELLQLNERQLNF